MMTLDNVPYVMSEALRVVLAGLPEAEAHAYLEHAIKEHLHWQEVDRRASVRSTSAKKRYERYVSGARSPFWNEEELLAELSELLIEQDEFGLGFSRRNKSGYTGCVVDHSSYPVFLAIARLVPNGILS